MGRIGKFIKDEPGKYRVWAESDDSDYVGPVADVYEDKNWVFIVTDRYEGVAMINREALPSLIKALKGLEKYLSEKV